MDPPHRRCAGQLLRPGQGDQGLRRREVRRIPAEGTCGGAELRNCAAAQPLQRIEPRSAASPSPNSLSCNRRADIRCWHLPDDSSAFHFRKSRTASSTTRWSPYSPPCNSADSAGSVCGPRRQPPDVGGLPHFSQDVSQPNTAPHARWETLRGGHSSRMRGISQKVHLGNICRARAHACVLRLVLAI